MNLYYSFYKGLPRRSKALLLPKLLPSSQTNHHNDNDVIGRKAAFSSSSREEDRKKNYNRNYLDNWVGTISNKTGNSSVNSSTDNNNPTATVKTTQQSSFTQAQSQAQTLQITGSSYLLPTLRLPSNTTASSLSKNLSFFLLRDTSSHAMKSMLKPNNRKTKSLSSSSSSWKVPIILDLAEYQHDGSPHYKPPPSNFVKSIVSVLDKEFGICVIGLTNVQQIPGEHVNEDMISLGLPVVLGRAGVNGSGSTRTNNNSNSVGIEELIQLVLKKNDEESVLADEKEVEEEMNVNSKGNDNPENSSMNSISRNDIMNKMTFRELQTECKSLGLGAIGSTSVLQTRLLDYYEYNNDLEKDGKQQGKEDKDKKEDSNDTVNKHSDITPTPPPTASNNLSIDTPSISSSVTLTSSTVDSSPLITSLVPTDDAAAAAFVHAKIYHGSVRSGQQISTDEPNQSLIIMGNVNSGGEVMADGSIYIFGRLRGRALAGLKESPSSSSNYITNKEQQQEKGENTNDSKIICTHFDAELVCIGESFTTIDDSNMDSTIGVKQGSSVMITKDEKDGSLHFVGF